MEEFDIIFYGFYAALLLTPVIAFLLRRRFQKQDRLIFYSTTILAAIVCLSVLTDFSISGVSVDAITLFFLYFLIGICIFKLTIIKNHVAKAIGIFGVVVLIAVPAFCIPAVLGVALIVGGFEPVYLERHGRSHTCRVTSYGSATTSTGGYNAQIYRTFMFIEHETYSKKVESTRKPEMTADKACDLAFSEFRNQ